MSDTPPTLVPPNAATEATAQCAVHGTVPISSWITFTAKQGYDSGPRCMFCLVDWVRANIPAFLPTAET